MASEAFEAIAEDFEFLDDWEQRYAMVIELGKAMEPLPEALKVPATKVNGCASQVWMVPEIADGIFHVKGDSDGMIARGIVALLSALYNGLPVDEIGKVDSTAELARLHLEEHLSAQRTNGLRAMVKRIQTLAAEAV